MPKQIFNKLVRDNIPEIIRSNGETPVFHVLEDGPEFDEVLKQKAREELEEFLAGPSAVEKADLDTVIAVIMQRSGISAHDVGVARAEKLHTHGGFEQRIFLEGVE